MLRKNGADGTEHIGLLVTNLISVEGNWRLHSYHTEYLDEMVLDHVSEGASFIIIDPSVLYSHLLRHRNLDIVDVSAIPYWLEEGICEAECQDVLHSFLSEIM